MAFSQLQKAQDAELLQSWGGFALKMLRFKLPKIRKSLTIWECLSALHYMKFNTLI